MTDTLTIAVADRNPHIRSFLRTEFVAEGYHVLLAKDGKELLVMLNSNKPPDLLILDPDIPHINGLQVLEWLKDHRASLPVVIHTYDTEFMKHSAVQERDVFLEKTGSNIEYLKSTVDRLLRRSDYNKAECLSNGHRIEFFQGDRYG